ncbi:MAG: ATP-binding protein [Myxococcales bacterium]|nr:ATP-binding protein [Myxococcales bacterium]
MSILEFSYTDHTSGWEIRPTTFKPSLNLLVGISGAGKTQTLSSLFATCKAGLHEEYVQANCEWSLRIAWQGAEYQWRARTIARSEDDAEVGGTEEDHEDFSEFATESITRDGVTLFERTPSKTSLNGALLPEFNREESGVRLFRADEKIAPLARALAHVRLSYEKLLRRVVREDGLPWSLKRHENSRSISDLSRDLSLMLPLKAYVLQEKFPDDFRLLIVGPFQDIFPTITDIRVGLAASLFPAEAHQRPRKGLLLDVAVREKGVRGWISSEELAEGMHRTLVHLIELVLAPPGTVLLIDEYERSMGVNCLPAVTEHLLDRAGELQFIITSHHPYVIGNIAKEHWMLVRRHGSVVTIAPALSIPSLDTRSNQDAFIQLLNAEEYTEGVS